MNPKYNNYFLEARKFQYEGMLPQAINLYTKILKKYPKDLQTLHFLGLTYAQLGDMDKTISYLLAAENINDKDAGINNNLGNAYKGIGNIEEAIKYYKKALAIDPVYAQAHNNLASIYTQQNNYALALEHYRKAVHSEPDFSIAHFNLGVLLLKIQQLEAAKKQFKNVLALNPDHLEAKFLPGVLYLENEKFDKAKSNFEDLINVDPENLEALNNLGVIALKQDKSQLAIDYFTRALAIDNNHIDARSNLASTFMHHDRYENALMHYDELLKKDSDNIEYNYNSGVAQMALGHLQEAINHFNLVLDVQEENFAALNNLAAIYIKLKDRNKAISLLEKAVLVNPNDSSSKHMLHALKGGTPKSIDSSKYAAHLFDNYALYYDQHMQGPLKYTVPQNIAKIIHELKLFSLPNVLDLGCGTGLAGGVLREISISLTGVDISKKMLVQAREKQIYDHLIEAEITQFLHKNKQKFELIVAADVLPYFGDLDLLFKAISSSLAEKGTFIFTTETCENGNWALQTNARFCHNLDYIKELCKALNYSILIQKEIPGRLQDDKPVSINLYVIQII